MLLLCPAVLPLGSGVVENGLGPDFYAGLYETSTSTDIRFEHLKDQLPKILAWALVAFLFIALVSFALIAAASGLAGENVWKAIQDSVPTVVAPSSLFSVIGAFFVFYAQSAKVDREESRPSSDEQFSQRFKDLIDEGRKEHKFDRLVVFIDELDRCSEDDIAATLTAIRTFLEVKPCVFIVAADRDVLERSLHKLPQQNPDNEADPYYSAAREYFDKVFHDRISIPPLRHQSLYIWATKQVEAKVGGLWEELRERLDQQKMGRLLFDLVPSHVSSPRRVRALLNSFARTVAVAESRGVPWEGRELEVAKLVVLESEFPHLARDMRVDHRLPGFILEAPPQKVSKRTAKILVKYVSDFSDYNLPEDFEVPDKPTYSGGDTYLAEGRAKKETEHENLIKYLKRTSETIVSRDLIFMEHAGQSQGMEDPELGLILESAIDEPDEVVERFEQQAVEDRRQALVVLAYMLRSEGREESRMYFHALVGIAETLLPDEIGDVPDRIDNALITYLGEQPLTDAQILPVFEIAMASSSAPFKARALSLDGLFDRSRLADVAVNLAKVPAPFKKKIYARIGEELPMYEGAWDSALRVVRELPASESKLALADPNVREGLVSVFSGEAHTDDGAPVPNEYIRDEFLAPLFDSMKENGELDSEALGLIEELISRDTFADFGFDRAKLFLPRIEVAAEKNRAVIGLMNHVPFDEVKTYGDLLETDPKSVTNAGVVLRRILPGIQDRPDLALPLAEATGRLLPFVDSTDKSESEAVKSAYLQLIESRTWWDGKSSSDAQAELHSQVREISDDDSDVLQRLVQDLNRARPSLDPPGATVEANYSIRVLGAPLIENFPEEVLAFTRASQSEESLDLSMAIARTRYHLLSLAAPGKRGAVNYEDAKQAVNAAGNTDADDVLKSWFELSPPTNEVYEVLIASPTDRSVTGTGLATWCEKRPPEDLTSLAIRLAERSKYSDLKWIEILLQKGADDTEITRRLIEIIQAETNGQRRRDKSAYLAKLGERSSDSQRAVADLMIKALQKEKQIDFDMALDLIPALGNNHRRGGKLVEEFKKAAKSGRLVSGSQYERLRDRGVKLPDYARKKKSRRQKAKESLEGIAGRFKR